MNDFHLAYQAINHLCLSSHSQISNTVTKNPRILGMLEDKTKADLSFRPQDSSNRAFNTLCSSPISPAHIPGPQ